MLMKPVRFPPGRGRPRYEAIAHRVGDARKYDRDRPRLALECGGPRSRVREDCVGSQIDQLFREHPHQVDIAGGPTNVHPQITAIDPTQLLKPLRERGEPGLRLGIGFAQCHEHADPPHAVGLLRPRRERPSDRRAAHQRDELPSPHSITSSVIARSPGGTSMPSVLAVLRLMTNSNLVDCATGRSAGLAPLRMLPV
jgi:hypothetical protein